MSMKDYEQGIMAAIKQGQLKQAEKTIQQAIEFAIVYHQELEAYELVETLRQLGYLDYALLACQCAMQNWENDEWDLLLAELYMDNDDLDDALERLLMINEQSSLYPSALVMMAELYQLEELYEVSEQKLLHAKQIVPDEPIIDFALGELYGLMGEYQNALMCYQKVETAHIIEKEELYKKIARMLMALGEFEEAIVYLEKLTMEEHHSESMFELGLAYYQIQEYERSIKWFEELLAKDPDYLSAHHYLAKALIETRQTDKAKTFLEHALKENPYQSALYVELYALYTQYKLWEKREQLIEQAREYLPDDTTLNVLYAYLLKEKEWYDELIEFVEKQLEEDEDSEFYWLLAYAYGKNEQDDKAQHYYTLAYRMFYEDAQFLEDYALYLREIGKKDELANIMVQLKQINPEWTLS
ncbi:MULTISPECIES: tetratricopeptide repeat protein [unclassified Granulicatella]|uniref:tetratricopeptide repeat protein n=1 Tax=unclassified Granulicatella TaxID=2630493 RepID=UPI0014308CBD|nr:MULTISPECIES: tetratricopeptide repeat protein [unclassified Granulicatella]MBF0780046.1 tetratricopeptide repeat protein [Granulicatella sp. 19428wC4_WM01]